MLLSSTGVIPSSQHKKEFAWLRYKVEELNKNTDAMKNRLDDLENVKLLSPDDLDIIEEKRILRQKIAKMEHEDSDGHEMAA